MLAIVADDHPAIAIGIGRLLETIPGTSVLTATTASDLIRLSYTEQCELIITDLNMPGSSDADGFRLIEQLRRSVPEVPIVIITTLAVPPILRTVMRSSIQGLVHKLDAVEELRLATRKVLEGGRYISTTIARALVMHPDGTSPAVALSSKEADVLRLICMAYTVTDIGRMLNRSVKTISGHKRDLMAKLNLEDDLALYEFVRSYTSPLSESGGLT